MVASCIRRRKSYRGTNVRVARETKRGGVVPSITHPVQSVLQNQGNLGGVQNGGRETQTLHTNQGIATAGSGKAAAGSGIGARRGGGRQATAAESSAFATGKCAHGGGGLRTRYRVVLAARFSLVRRVG